LFFSLLALAALAVLASSLNDVHFEPGRAASSIEMPKAVFLPSTTGAGESTPLWKTILIWTIFLINLVLFFYLLPPEVRKRLLLQAIRFTLTVVAIFYALRNRVFQATGPDSGNPVEGNLAAQPGSSSLEVPPFQPPALSPWMIYLVSLAVILVLVVLAWFVYRLWTRFQARQISPLEAIAGVARSSLDDLAAGRDWGDVIIESYVRMGEAVSSRRGLARTAAMTPREFAARLERAGLPAGAVSRLTRLFESVRYGGQRSSQADVDEAMACLGSILQACGAMQ